MSELTIMHKYGISATYYDNKFEAVQKDDLNKMLDEFNKRNINVHNIYFNGDGAGKAGNIVAAAATGLIAARDILNKDK